MKKALIILSIIALLYLAYWGYSKYTAGVSLLINPKNVDLRNLQDPKIEVELTNPTNTSINLNSFAAEIQNNGSAIATVKHLTPLIITANSTTTLTLSLSLNTASVLSALNGLSSGAMKFQMVGTATAEGISFPVNKIIYQNQ